MTGLSVRAVKIVETVWGLLDPLAGDGGIRGWVG